MDNLVAVEPTEYSERQIKRYFGYKIAIFDAEKLKEVIKDFKVQADPKIWQDGDMVCYQYPKKPIVIIKNGRLFTTEEMWNGKEFSDREIRHQTSILLRILGQAKLASYKRTTIARYKFTPRKWR
jgi:hypothetical protein